MRAIWAPVKVLQLVGLPLPPFFGYVKSLPVFHTFLGLTLSQGIASGLYTRSRPGFGDRRSIAAEAFGWIPFVTTVLTLLATVHRAGRVASSPTGGGYVRSFLRLRQFTMLIMNFYSDLDITCRHHIPLRNLHFQEFSFALAILHPIFESPFLIYPSLLMTILSP